jgi:hypothetical protein
VPLGPLQTPYTPTLDDTAWNWQLTASARGMHCLNFPPKQLCSPARLHSIQTEITMLNMCFNYNKKIHTKMYKIPPYPTWWTLSMGEPVCWAAMRIWQHKILLACKSSHIFLSSLQWPMQSTLIKIKYTLLYFIQYCSKICMNKANPTFIIDWWHNTVVVYFVNDSRRKPTYHNALASKNGRYFSCKPW